MEMTIPQLSDSLAAGSSEFLANVELALQSTMEVTPEGGDRRQVERHAYPHPIYLTPVDEVTQQPNGETIVVLGKHLSELGLDFYFNVPVVYRRVVVSLESPSNEWISFLMDLNRCRFNRHGWYENGGKFLQVVQSPLSDGDAILPD